MKRNKGKVHPLSSSSSSPNESVLNLLPASIISLVSVLSLDERHVLAYMITRSLKSTTTHLPDKSKNHHQATTDSHGGAGFFDCDCFHCYTTFWFRWDSSPNRELIHQAIEAFEDGEFKKSKRKDKSGRRRQVAERMSAVAAGPPEEILANNVEAAVDAVAPPVVNHRGLARKMLPDVMGIFNSRLWSLWSPNV